MPSDTPVADHPSAIRDSDAWKHISILFVNGVVPVYLVSDATLYALV